MKRSLLLLAAVLLPATAHARTCQEERVPYATDSVITFCLSSYDSANADDNKKVSLKVDATFAAGDIVQSIDGGAESNIDTLPTDEGKCYTQPISVAESTGKAGYIDYVDQDSTRVWIDHCIHYRTFGHASSFYGAANIDLIENQDASDVLDAHGGSGASNGISRDP